jgi:hypothetical protein
MALRSPTKPDDGGYGLGLRNARPTGKFMLGSNGWQQLSDSPARDGPRARVALLAPGGQRGGQHNQAPPAGPSRPAPVVSGQRRASGAAGAGGAAAKGQTGVQPPLPPPLAADKAAPTPRGAAVPPPQPSPLGGSAGRLSEGPFSLQPKGGSRASGNGCNCKQSKCLKLYCVCFAKGGVCGPQCQCATCHNKDAYSEEVRAVLALCPGGGGEGVITPTVSL